MKKPHGYQLNKGYIIPKVIINKTKATNENAHRQQKVDCYATILWINMQKLLKTNYLVNNHKEAGWGWLHGIHVEIVMFLPRLILSHNCGARTLPYQNVQWESSPQSLGRKTPNCTANKTLFKYRAKYNY